MGIEGNLGGSGVGGYLDGSALHQFDTGLFRPQRTMVRQFLRAALGVLLKANGGYVHKIGALPRPLHGPSEDELGLLVTAVANQTPAILIALGDKDIESTGMDATECRGELEIVIYAMSSSQRSFIDGRLEADAVAVSDASTDPGIETLLEHIEELVLGQSLPIQGIAELRGHAEKELYTFAEYTVWTQRYTAKVERVINRDRAVAGIVTTVAVLSQLDGANAVNPIVETITNLEVP